MNEQEHLPIKAWAKDDRPREKMLSKGHSALSDAELIAILIGSGNTEETAVDLAKRLLASVDNNLNKLGKLGIAELRRFKGIGEARAVTIAAAMELGRRRKNAESPLKTKITTSKQVFDIFYPLLADLNYEEFWLLFVNRAGTVINKIKVGQGGVENTSVDVKICVKLALENSASSVVAVHNHPSGNCNPGVADKALTNKLKTAFEYFNIILSDHIIIADAQYFSFADNVLL
ncbi:MAG: DNA repair protein RadC [Prevotellaceae bacterium]|jgi:DNA repair protein RadC|nr:DNA repair protein RadC [Prevotellaceae bacterium]